jgi:hypothetical protein
MLKRDGFAACVLLAMGAGGCGNISTESTDGGDARAPVSVAQACSDVDTSLCSALGACSAFALQLTFGDMATCVTRNDLGCTIGQMEPGVGRTTDDLEACAHAVPAATCPDLIAGKMPAACQDKPGTVINGAACGAATQCQSTFCNKNGACGVCAPRQAAGQSCNSDPQCAQNLVCASGSSCVMPAEANIACDDKHPCRADLYCKAGVCSTKGGAGDSCADTDKACDLLKGVGCNPFTKICQNIHVAKKGDPCGIVAGTLVLCEASGLCEGATLAVPGTCTAAAADGAACSNDAGGRSCLPPANCVNGICRLPATSSCQ